jgi:hypothetical protein
VILYWGRGVVVLVVCPAFRGDAVGAGAVRVPIGGREVAEVPAGVWLQVEKTLHHNAFQASEGTLRCPSADHVPVPITSRSRSRPGPDHVPVPVHGSRITAETRVPG